MTSITRKFEFAMGHTLHNHPGSCSHLHGHNYLAFITVSATELDANGMVVDFTDLKKTAGGFIDSQLDHRFMVQREDPRAEGLVALDDTVAVVDWHPTAENIANFLLCSLEEELRESAFSVEEVTLWETSNCSATVRRS
jgi:6-pyruvoyltetrahydropterin/6-carboxytetrahydropterin synthase